MPDATTADFDEESPPLAGDEWVVRTGKLFEAGDFADKEFSITPDEMANALTDFAPVKIGLSHTPTVLDGKLGHLFEAEARGAEMHGSVRLPKWLDDLLASGQRKVSCVWDRATKRLMGLDLVPVPRIPDAVLMAAFSAAHPEAEVAVAFAASMEIQTLVFSKDKFSKAQAIKWCKDHDFKAEVDETDDSYRMRQANPGAFEEGSFRTKALTDGVKAVMGKRKAKAAMSADGDEPDPAAAFGSLIATFTARKQHPTLNVAMQHVHDLMALYPNGCPKVEAVAAFGDIPKQRKAVRALHDATLDHGATCPGGSKAKFGAIAPRRKSMSFAQKLGRVLFGGGVAEMELAPDIDEDQARAALAVLTGDDPTPPPNPKPPITPPPPPPASFAESPEAKALQTKIAELERKATEREAAERASRAATFAQQAKHAGHVTPALEADLAALFSQALADDATAEAKVTFSEGSATKQGSRLDALAAFVAKLPKHRLTEDLIDPKGRLETGATALFNRSDKDPAADLDAEVKRRIDRMYGTTNGSAR